ncbi:hypothetical protein JHK85_025210 [Glycine max]|nr:hypothetical protein JHK85_025210 [Glycine max]
MDASKFQHHESWLDSRIIASLKLASKDDIKGQTTHANSTNFAVGVTKSQQDSDSVKALKCFAYERIEPTSEEELGVQDKDSRTIEAKVVEKIRVEEAENL